MNQILNTKFVNKNQKLKKYIVQFSISIIILLFFIFISIKNKIDFNIKQNVTNNIANNYRVYKLYSNNNLLQNDLKDSNILGNITIPKLNINYPFFYGISDNLLKIAPCRFSGKMPPQISNLCIAGHNYNDDRFFSRISELNLEDIIIIEDNYKNQFEYYIYDKYEIPEDKIYNVTSLFSNSCELTLVTCNNINNNRIVIKSKMKAYNK